MVQRHKHTDESIKNIVNDAEKQIEELIYEFVYDLVESSATEAREEFSYYCEILSQDYKFMSGRKHTRR